MAKILIFDAYPSIRQLLAEELAADGYVTLNIGRAECVLESVGRLAPDLIVLDLYMRGQVLGHLLEQLKERHPAIPLLLFTAFHPKEMPRIPKADGWVQKSFLFGELKEKIRELLGGKNEPSVLRTPVLAKGSPLVGSPESP
jgi:DNA-binding response OmpR family regulator